MFDPIETILKNRRRVLKTRAGDNALSKASPYDAFDKPPPEDWHSTSLGGLWEQLNEATRFWPEKQNCVRVYEPAASTAQATLWLQRYEPERLDDWLDRHDRLRAWLEARQ
jgi:hypothetical protein